MGAPPPNPGAAASRWELRPKPRRARFPRQGATLSDVSPFESGKPLARAGNRLSFRGAMRLDRMTTKAQEAVRAAADLASRRGNPELYPEHLLHAIVEQDGGVGGPLLQKAGADPANVLRLLEAKIEGYPRVSGGAEPGLSRRGLAVLQKAEDEAKALKDDFISTEHVLLGAA